ncbi:unnamed protein product [Choristocarpus tenellus]
MADPSTADVQAELKEYLNLKNINRQVTVLLFIQIVERLLIEKPDNPIGFIVDYLVKKYPDQTRAAASGLRIEPHRSQSGTRTVSRVESEEETESDEDEYVGDLEPKPTTFVKPAGRRTSVSAEQVGPNAKSIELKVVPKNEDESARILDILGDNIIIKHLDMQQTNQVKDAMFLVEKLPGDVVIQAGDTGDNFYVIDQGTIDVYMNKSGDTESKMKSMGPGESFGELALMYSTPRTATCKAATALRLWALDRISFKVILQATTKARRKQYKTFLDKVPILEQLTEYEVLTIADALTVETYEDGDVVCEDGEVGDAFYIIKKGEAACIQCDATGVHAEVARLDDGAYFGEVALMYNKPRQATVKAIGHLEVLSLDRKTFKRVMGPMEDILKRNMSTYKNITARTI